MHRRLHCRKRRPKHIIIQAEFIGLQ